MSNPTNFRSPFWVTAQPYKQFDIVDGSSSAREAYYYATQDNISQNPLNNWSLNGSSWNRIDGIATVITSSSISPPLTRGSWVQIVGGAELNYTGCLIDGGSNYVRFPSRGPDSSGATSAVVQSTLSPAWTTGFGFIPSYSSTIDSTQNVLTAQFGDSYNQKMRGGINCNMENYSLVFENVSNREAAAIKNFVQDKGGVEWTRIILGDGEIQTNPSNKFVLKDPKVAPKSHGLSTVTIMASQVFDPS